MMIEILLEKGIAQSGMRCMKKPLLPPSAVSCV